MQVSSPLQPAPSPRMAGTKRSAPDVDDAYPGMSKKDAAIAFRRLLSSVPKKPKRQSLYVRFKYVLLQDASCKGETDKIANITELAKEQWKVVRNLDTSHISHHDKENIDSYLIDAKRRAEDDELHENQAHAKTLKEWCERFHIAASAHLSYLTMDANEGTYQILTDAIRKVENVREWSSQVPKFHLFALAKAKEELEKVHASMTDKALVTRLHNATLLELYQHAKDYREKVERIEELESVKDQLNTMKYEKEIEKKLERERDQDMAANLVSDIVKNLERQMIYDASLKAQSKKVSYQRSGVKSEIFCSAFKVPIGTKKAIIAADSVPPKMLRYGASLECGNVEVKLSGNGDLVASGWYRMNTNPHSRFRS